MTYEEYETMKNELTTENAPIVVGSILDALKTDLAERDALKAEVEAKDKKIADLQDTNMKLFLNQTNDESGEEEDDEEKFIADVESEIEKMLTE